MRFWPVLVFVIGWLLTMMLVRCAVAQSDRYIRSSSWPAGAAPARCLYQLPHKPQIASQPMADGTSVRCVWDTDHVGRNSAFSIWAETAQGERLPIGRIEWAGSP